MTRRRMSVRTVFTAHLKGGAKGRQRVEDPVEELGAEAAMPLLREYYRRFRVTRRLFDVSLDSPRDAWLAESPRHPVFRLVSEPS